MQTSDRWTTVARMSGPTDARPLQVRVADDLRQQIETGTLQAGQQLPTYDDLAERYLCSLAVVRKAVELLKNQGLVVTVQGRGTYVRERPRARRHGMDRYSRSRWKSADNTAKPILIAEAEAQGHKAGQQLRELAEVAAPEKVAERLNIDPGLTVWVRRRTTFIDDRANQLADSYYPLDVAAAAPRIREEDTGPGGGFARLEDAGFHLHEICEEWNVRMPSGPETVALQLPAGTPVVDLARTTYDTTGRAVEVMLAVLAGDMTSFAYRFPIPN
jgi:GntR family transcriptional regulator